ncbi:amino acid ABC transporter substrate-binding protein [Shewanella psychropiezotolerans]|uniref:Amino acid ABC transporter substrate-binding protein n=1 Tax=Shewanella psychropiezotolerans TaxID=2593655 RepID=A0ABX5X3P9_9GAMM|nr:MULTISPECIES: transporter substrate-binding domain-containing protein [Shewanella]MPY25473.1 amino acid ABC transporter substrate-binding protein [Shewanella sp. YLB-07]QDO85973.1 amino acid ABC transporter substrate-binding protein [Shewanella psychropiezotolerans]
MIIRFSWIISALLFGFVISAPLAEQDYLQPKLKFCVESTEFPPFNYFKRVKGKKTESSGYDVDLLKQVFEPAGIEYQVIVLPWRRCLKEVYEGIVDAAMSASLNPQRIRDYIPSAPYYHITPSYFYLEFNYPDGLDISNLSELDKLGKVCGIVGFNYLNFGWDSLDKLYEINDISQLPTMLQKSRCRFFLARKETFAGTLAINNMYYLGELLTGKVVPNSQPEPFHMLVSKKSAYGNLINQLFNKKVLELRKSGELDRLLEYHLNELRKGAKEAND